MSALATGSNLRTRAVGLITGVAAASYVCIQLRKCAREQRSRRAVAQLEKWREGGPAQEPVIDCEVPVEHGMSGDDVYHDVVQVPVGLLFECARLRTVLQEAMKTDSETETIEALETAARAAQLRYEAGEDDDDVVVLAEVSLPWIDLAALAQLTYWYDRRPHGERLQERTEAEKEDAKAPPPVPGKDATLAQAKYGRWTKKVSREKVVYGTVALKQRAYGHLGQEVFRRPAGVDVTRLTTLRRGAALTGHGPLLDLVEETMTALQPKNVAQISWEEVKKHTASDDLWLLIDGKVYDVTTFLGLHPGGGHHLMMAAGMDSTAKFEMTHGEGLRYSLRLLNQFFIGVCKEHQLAEPLEPNEPTPEFLQTLRSITGALHTFDEAKATGEAQGLLRKD